MGDVKTIWNTTQIKSMTQSNSFHLCSVIKIKYFDLKTAHLQWRRKKKILQESCSLEKLGYSTDTH